MAGLDSYGFDTLIDRNNTGSAKWEDRTEAEKEQGIVPMTVADMDLPSPDCVREALVKAARHGIYGYTCRTQEYDDAVLGWMKRRFGMDAEASDFVVTTGVVPALGVAVRTLTKPGDGVILEPPVYPPFRSSIINNGRRPEYCPLLCTEEGYKMDFEALEKAAAKPDVSLMILCSPHNPVGRVWTREELEKVNAICRKNNVVVVSDEIHADLIHTGKQIAFSTLSEETKQNSIVCTAPSKTFNIPGLSTSNIFIANPEMRKKFSEEAWRDGCGSLGYFGYAATIAAYNGGEEWLGQALSYIYQNYEILKGFLKEHIPGARIFPLEGTYLAWVDLRCLGIKDMSVGEFLRKRAGFLVNDGAMFGPEGEGFVRVMLALPKTILEERLQKLGECVANLATD